MTPTDLIRIGEALFGTRWRTALANAIGMSRRHLHRLEAGEWPVTNDVAAKIRGLAKARISGIRSALKPGGGRVIE